jgi:hypothetical protein
LIDEEQDPGEYFKHFTGFALPHTPMVVYLTAGGQKVAILRIPVQ